VNISIQSAIHYIYHYINIHKEYTSIIKKFVTFACGSFFTRSITLLFAPITMQLLTPTDYGLLALTNSFISILTALLGLGLRQMLPLHYFSISSNERVYIIIDIICIYLIISIPTLCLFSCNLNLLNEYLFLGQASKKLLFLSLFISFIYFFVELFYQLLQYQQEAWHLTKVQAIITIVTISCNLIFLCIFNLGIYSIFIGQAIGMTLVCFICVKEALRYDYKQYLNMDRSLQAMKLYLSRGLPFIPSMLFGLLLASGDRWVLARLSTMHNVGIYSVANTLAQLANMIIFYAITGSYMPHMLNSFALNSTEIKKLERQNKIAMWASMGTSFILISLGFASSKWLLYFFIPKAFQASIGYMYLLLLGSIFLLGTQFLNCLIQFKKKSLFLGLILCLPASLNVILNIILIPYLELYGCVLATLISYISYFAITYLYNVRLLKDDVRY
jgi:O-antigen/teichoic acid export membrane protein